MKKNQFCKLCFGERQWTKSFKFMFHINNTYRNTSMMSLHVCVNYMLQGIFGPILLYRSPVKVFRLILCGTINVKELKYIHRQSLF